MWPTSPPPLRNLSSIRIVPAAAMWLPVTSSITITYVLSRFRLSKISLIEIVIKYMIHVYHQIYSLSIPPQR